MKRLTIRCIACAALFLCGCATERYVTDAKHPDIAITADGGVTFRGRFVEPEDLPGLLRDTGFTRSDTINIHYPDGRLFPFQRNLSAFTFPYEARATGYAPSTKH